MDSEDARAPDSRPGIAVAAVVLVAILAVVGYLAWDRFQGFGEEAPVVTADRAGDAAGAAPLAADTASQGAAAGPAPPTFDVVRIGREGLAVIAGRAEPGAVVTVREGETILGEVTADARGEWVLLPEEPIQPGTRELALTARTVEGVSIESEQVVVLSIPAVAPGPAAAGTGGVGALAVLVPREDIGGSRVLQAPAAGVGLEGEGGLSLDTIEYDAKGNIVLGGRASPGGRVMVYLDNRLIGSAEADAQQRWRVTPEAAVSPGLHTLRIDEVDVAGKVVARLETPFSRAEFRLPTGGEALVIVQPGNSLWRIARRTYGRGIQYVQIFAANRDQIRDADLIYPGQIFLIPAVN